jgi:hypothetical protein
MDAFALLCDITAAFADRTEENDEYFSKGILSPD